MKPTEIVQVAYHVPDVEQACQRLNKLYGVAPFVRAQNMPLDIDYRGTHREELLELDVAFVISGNINIEVIKQLDSGPSAFRDVYRPEQFGMHHTAFFADDYQAQRAHYLDSGFDLVMEINVSDTCKVAFFDTRPLLGHMTEIYTDGPEVRETYSIVARQTASWNGTDLMVPYE